MIITVSQCHVKHKDDTHFHHRATGIWCYKEQETPRNLRYYHHNPWVNNSLPMERHNKDFLKNSGRSKWKNMVARLQNLWRGSKDI